MHPVQLSLSLHEQITSVCDNPILMVMDPEQKPGAATSSISGELPLRAYEPIYIDLKIEFVELPLRIETGEAERIAVADVVKGSGAADHELASRLGLQASALRMFHQRLAAIRRYVRDVRSGEAPPDYDLLRRINAFTTQLSKHEPLNDKTKTNGTNCSPSGVVDALNVQELDAMVATLLGLVMKVERDKFELNTKWLALKNSKSHTGGGGGRHKQHGQRAADIQEPFDDESLVMGASRRTRRLQHALTRNPGKGKQKRLHT
ncbi:hypothetical protein D0Z03_000503 [Geotrichum reessii]|nr:hypothetical protein D0Z03_000503 [Galactomyces reessii]